MRQASTLHSLPPVPSIPLLPYLTLHSHTLLPPGPRLLHPSTPAPPLVFNKAVVPSSFPNPLLIPFWSSSDNTSRLTKSNHVRYSPHPPHLSTLFRKSSLTPVTRLSFYCALVLEEQSSSTLRSSSNISELPSIFSPLWITRNNRSVQRPIFKRPAITAHTKFI